MRVDQTDVPRWKETGQRLGDDQVTLLIAREERIDEIDRNPGLSQLADILRIVLVSVAANGRRHDDDADARCLLSRGKVDDTPSGPTLQIRREMKDRHGSALRRVAAVERFIPQS